jgi:hypothetical protein
MVLSAQRTGLGKVPRPGAWPQSERGGEAGGIPARIHGFGSASNTAERASARFAEHHKEWNSEPRIIPLDGRPHGPASVRTYAGDASGRWEGDTLVVETVNFSPKRDFFGSPGTFTLVERFTRISDDTIVHTYTVDDPTTWTRPWSVELPMQRINGPMLEYACNENNIDVFHTLRNARAEEQGKLAPPTAVRRGDSKAVITDRVGTDAEQGTNAEQ